MGETDYSDNEHWETLWSRTIKQHSDQVAMRPPNPHLVDALKNLTPGTALDAGCGHGAEARWLASRGWHVTGVDFSETALAYARRIAEKEALAERTEWIQADLGHWSPESERFDLVIALYVHAPDSIESLIRRLASGVSPGGSIFMVGHRPIDPATGEKTAAFGQNQISIDAARSELPLSNWDLLVAKERSRTAGSGVDAVVHALRRSVESRTRP